MSSQDVTNGIMLEGPERERGGGKEKGGWGEDGERRGRERECDGIKCLIKF